MFSKWTLASSVMLLVATSIIAGSTGAPNAADDNSDSRSASAEKPQLSTLVDDKGSELTPPPDSHLLDDLTRIRQQMGGSVLGGSSLDDPDAGRAFQANLQTLLSQPDPPSTPPWSGPLAAPRPTSNGDTLFPFPSQENHKSPPVVVTLRQQSEQIERIANQLERIRQYLHADALRGSAKTLRELARSLDMPPLKVPIPRSK